MEKQFISPRKVEEQVREYKHKRFEDYMNDVDAGRIPRAVAFLALREEMDYAESTTLPSASSFGQL